MSSVISTHIGAMNLPFAYMYYYYNKKGLIGLILTQLKVSLYPLRDPLLEQQICYDIIILLLLYILLLY